MHVECLRAEINDGTDRFDDIGVNTLVREGPQLHSTWQLQFSMEAFAHLDESTDHTGCL